MPSTYAHYKFGKTVLEQYPAPLAKIVREHRQLYNIGLHGPDILFYYRALTNNPVNAVGFGMPRASSSPLQSRRMPPPKTRAPRSPICWASSATSRSIPPATAISKTKSPFRASPTRRSRASSTAPCSYRTGASRCRRSSPITSYRAKKMRASSPRFLRA